MRDRVRLAVRTAGLFFASLSVPGCIEADMQTEVREDGSGTLAVSMKLTEKTVEIAHKMKKMNSKGDDIGKAMADFPKLPSEALAEELAKGGLKVLESSTVSSEKEMGAKVKVEFARLSALALMDRLESSTAGKKAKSPGNDTTLTRDDKGVYTLACSMDPDDSGGGAEAEEGEAMGGEVEAPGEAGAEAVDPEKAQEQMAEAMALMGELMGEAAKLKIVVGIKVPGEVVDHFPKAGAKVEGGKVTWTMDMGSMMQMGMQGAADPDAGKMRVLFKMPEGKSLPESALSEAKPAAAPAPPAGPAGPPSPLPPAPPPGGGEK